MPKLLIEVPEGMNQINVNAWSGNGSSLTYSTSTVNLDKAERQAAALLKVLEAARNDGHLMITVNTEIINALRECKEAGL